MAIKHFKIQLLISIKNNKQNNWKQDTNNIIYNNKKTYETI